MSSKELVYLIIVACAGLFMLCLAAILKNRDDADTVYDESGDDIKKPSLLLHYIKVIAGFVVLMWFLNSSITLDSVKSYLGFNKNNADTQPVAQSPETTESSSVTQTMISSMPALSDTTTEYRRTIVNSGQDFSKHLNDIRRCIDGRGEMIEYTPGQCYWPVIIPTLKSTSELIIPTQVTTPEPSNNYNDLCIVDGRVIPCAKEY